MKPYAANALYYTGCAQKFSGIQAARRQLLENAQVEHDGTMQPRRDPSALDVACTLFGNNEAAQELAARMDVSRPHRNDISISSKLVALRRMMDEMFVNENECGTDPASETASISTLWLQALRALSKSSPNSANTFHSGTWQRRQMNTQMLHSHSYATIRCSTRHKSHC
ncbi:Protein of unknown function DUF3160 [Phytophthora cactorum]|nr:Protein of unknown function DUF3160 [Phytophthora cactorum]